MMMYTPERHLPTAKLDNEPRAGTVCGSNDDDVYLLNDQGSRESR